MVTGRLDSAASGSKDSTSSSAAKLLLIAAALSSGFLVDCRRVAEKGGARFAGLSRVRADGCRKKTGGR